MSPLERELPGVPGVLWRAFGPCMCAGGSLACRRSWMERGVWREAVVSMVRFRRDTLRAVDFPAGFLVVDR